MREHEVESRITQATRMDDGSWEFEVEVLGAREPLCFPLLRGESSRKGWRALEMGTGLRRKVLHPRLWAITAGLDAGVRFCGPMYLSGPRPAHYRVLLHGVEVCRGGGGRADEVALHLVLDQGGRVAKSHTLWGVLGTGEPTQDPGRPSCRFLDPDLKGFARFAGLTEAPPWSLERALSAATRGRLESGGSSVSCAACGEHYREPARSRADDLRRALEDARAALDRAEEAARDLLG